MPENWVEMGWEGGGGIIINNKKLEEQTRSYFHSTVFTIEWHKLESAESILKKWRRVEAYHIFSYPPTPQNQNFRQGVTLYDAPKITSFSLVNMARSSLTFLYFVKNYVRGGGGGCGHFLR